MNATCGRVNHHEWPKTRNVTPLKTRGRRADANRESSLLHSYISIRQVAFPVVVVVVSCPGHGHAVVALDVDDYYEHSWWLNDCAWISRHILIITAKEENVTKMACVIGLYLRECGRFSRLFGWSICKICTMVTGSRHSSDSDAGADTDASWHGRIPGKETRLGCKTAKCWTGAYMGADRDPTAL